VESYEIVEMIEELWKKAPKSLPLIGTVEGKRGFILLLPVDGLRVAAALAVGPQGGINEIVYVLDPSEGVVADQLIVASTDGGSAEKGVLLPLSDLRHKVKQFPRKERRAQALLLCNDAMWDFLIESNEFLLSAAYLRGIESTSQSLSWIVSAGAPSLGRGGGGVSGGAH